MERNNRAEIHISALDQSTVFGSTNMDDCSLQFSFVELHSPLESGTCSLSSHTRIEESSQTHTNYKSCPVSPLSPTHDLPPSPTSDLTNPFGFHPQTSTEGWNIRAAFDHLIRALCATDVPTTFAYRISRGVRLVCGASPAARELSHNDRPRRTNKTPEAGP